MASLTKQEIEELRKKLEEKQKEIKEIYDQLIEAGAYPLDDDFLDDVAGGIRTTNPPIVNPPVYRTDHSFR